jgi:hypothetical protein
VRETAPSASADYNVTRNSETSDIGIPSDDRFPAALRAEFARFA